MSNRKISPETHIQLHVDKRLLFILFMYPYLVRSYKRRKKLEKCIKIYERTKVKRIRVKQVKIVKKLIKEEAKDYDQMISRGQAYVNRRAQAKVKRKI